MSVAVVEQGKRGLAKVRNAGIAVSQGELGLFLDDDMAAPHDLLAHHLVAHADDL